MKHLLAIVAALLVCLSAADAQVETVESGGQTYAVLGNVEQDTYNVRLFLGPPRGAQQQKKLSVLFGVGEDGDGYRFDLGPNGWALTDTAGSRQVASGKGSPLPAGGELDLLIKRRDWLLTVAANGRVLAQVADGAHGAGKVAVNPALSAPWQGKAPVLQPVGRLAFKEGFMRPQDELEMKDWDTLGGTWQLHSVRDEADDMPWEKRGEQKAPQSARSANPFTISGWGEPFALVSTRGHWFWDDFRAGVSVRNAGADAVGFAFNIRSGDDYFVLHWSEWDRTMKPTLLRMLRVKDGQVQELARGWVNGQRDQWYRLEVVTTGTRIRAVLDEAVVMDVHHPESLGGEIGLFVAGGDKSHSGMFDDIVLRSVTGYDYDDRQWLARNVGGAEGLWSSEKVARENRPDNYAAVLNEPDGRVMIGRKSWEPSVVSARVSVPGVGQTVGLEAGIGLGAGSIRQVELSRDSRGVFLTLLHGGRKVETVRGLALPESGPVELKLDLTRPNECNAYVAGRLAVHTPCTEPAGGAVAIYARGFQGAEFRDVRVAFEREEDLERLPSQALFVNDPFMKHWSSPQGAWWPETNVESSANWWHVGDFYARADMLVPVKDGATALFAAESLEPGRGYAARITAAGEGRWKLQLVRNGQVVDETEVDEPESTTVTNIVGVPGRGEPEIKEVEQTIPPRIGFHVEKPYIWLTASGKQVASYRDPEPLESTRMALLGYPAADLQNVQVQRNQVRDYYFETAPYDWFTVGTWKVTTRFSCDPRWSFMAALADQNSVIFNKYNYTGDMTLEAHMGMRMDARGRGQYVRVGDLNLSMLARPFDMDHAYHFVTAGWDRHISDSLTYLARGTRHLAETREQFLPNSRRTNTRTRVLPTPWVAGGRDIHGAWYYFKARKQGKTLQHYIDNHLVHSVQDPDVLKTVSPAVWTYSTDIVVARVRIAYQERNVPGRLVDAPEGYQQPEPPAVTAPVLASPTHPGFQDDFESGDRGWTTYNQQSGIHRIVAAPGREGHSLQVTNPGVGGLLEAIAPISPAGVKAREVRKLAFDYRLDPGTRINLYLRIDEQYYYIHMNGPDEPNPFYLRLGEMPVEADGRWHSVEFPLGAALRTLEGADTPTGRIGTLCFGNLHRGDLQMGIGGNSLGAAYYLDNLELVSPGGAEFRAVGAERYVPEGASLLWQVGRKPVAEPARETPLVFTTEEQGRFVLSARVRLQDGSLSPTAHVPFQVAVDPLEVKPVQPEPGLTWHFQPFVFEFGGPNQPWLDPGTLSLSINGKAVRTPDGFFQVDWAERRIRFDLQDALYADDTPVRPKDRETLNVQLRYRDSLMRDGSVEQAWEAAAPADRTPPGPVELVDFLPPHTFEKDLEGWQASEQVALLRDGQSAASGRYSLMVQNQRWGGSYLAYPLTTRFSAGRYPLVEFDYRFHPGVMVDMILSGSHGNAGLGLSDQQSTEVGRVEGFQLDDQWHHAVVDIQAGLARLDYRSNHYDVRQIMIGDFGNYRSNGLGAYYRLDNFRLVPLVSGRRPLTINVRASDAGGIKGYSYLWTAGPDDEPDQTVDGKGPALTFENVPAGDAWLHIRACDNEGNWGPVSHYRFRVDDTLPKLVRSVPTADSRAAPQELSITVQDEQSMLNPEKLRLVIGGRMYEPNNPVVQFDPDAARLSVNWLAAHGDNPPVPNGEQVTMTVSAEDFAGNAMDPQKVTWTMDYSRDKTPPMLPTVQTSSLEHLLMHTFQDGTENWKGGRGRDAAGLESVPVEKGSDNKCLKLTAQHGRGRMTAIAFQGDVDLQRFPHVSFECAIPKDVGVNMQVQIDGAWHEVKLTAPKGAYNVMHDAGVEANGNWQSVSVDLLAIAEKARPDRKKHTLRAIMFGDMARTTAENGATWRLDNFALSSWGEKKGKFEFIALDVTGIKGYGVVIDRKSDTEPPEKVTHPNGTLEHTFNQPGTWYLHVRAMDNNGNWSTTRHMVYATAPPAPQAPADE